MCPLYQDTIVVLVVDCSVDCYGEEALGENEPTILQCYLLGVYMGCNDSSHAWLSHHHASLITDGHLHTHFENAQVFLQPK